MHFIIYQIGMEGDSEKLQIFANQMKNVKFDQLANTLRCQLCGGLLRFAHTLSDCGHTFCQICIFNYLKNFKGRAADLRCPQCKASIEMNLQKSIIRDIYKQSLVDLIDPSYVQRQRMIIDRASKLLPQYNLNFLLDDFSFGNSGQSKKKRNQRTRIMNGLIVTIKNKFGMAFQSFCDMITGEEGYQSLLQKLGSRQQAEGIILDIRPRSQQDYRFVGINNKIKVKVDSIALIRRFLQKRLLLRLQSHQQFARQLIDPQCSHLEVRIDMFLSQRLLTDKQRLQDVGIEQEPIYYCLLR